MEAKTFRFEPRRQLPSRLLVNSELDSIDLLVAIAATTEYSTLDSYSSRRERFFVECVSPLQGEDLVVAARKEGCDEKNVGAAPNHYRPCLSWPGVCKPSA